MTLLVVNSCSFHSIQYDYIKGLISQEEQDLQPQKNWTAIWMNQYIDLYAINVKDQVIFVDEEINIFFKEDQIYKITGLLPNNEILEIEPTKTSLKYKLNGVQISLDSCKEKKVLGQKNESIIYSRVCYQERVENSYKNEVIINSDNLITGLKFKVHPNYPLLELSKK